MFELLLPILAKVVPDLLGSALSAGKQDTLLGKAAEIAKDMLGSADPAALERLATDPALQEQYKARLQAETTELQLRLADVQDARHMQIALAQEHGLADKMPTVQSVMNYLLAIGIVVAVAMGWLREDGIVVGFAIGSYTNSNQFWLGSSNGSKRSGDAVRAIAASATSPSPAQIVSRVVNAAEKVANR